MKMELVTGFLAWFFDFQAFVMLPVIFLVIGLISKMKLTSALLNALKLGAGFAGIFMIFEVFLGILGPAVSAMSQVRGLDFPVVDAGWPPLAAITWSSWIAPVVIIAVIALNFLMLVSKTTTVLYIDIWNYWHFALIGSMLLALGFHPVVALGASVFAAALVIKTTEWSAPYVKAETGLTGVAVSPLTVSGFLPWALAMDWLIGHIPGLKSLRWDPSRGKDLWAKAGNPIIVGFLLGLLFGFLAGYDIKASSEMAVKIAAVMFILPRCGALIGEGTGAVSSALQERVAPLFGGRKLHIAMDTGFLLTHPSVIVTGLIMMPLSLLIAFVLPGNKVLPAGDLPNLISVMSVTVIICGGNVIRALIIGLPMIVAFLYAATALAPLITDLAAQAGALDNSITQVSSFTDGGNPLRWWIFELFQGKPLAIALLIPVLVLFFVAAKRSARASSKLN